jgi:hypothetical protein
MGQSKVKNITKKQNSFITKDLLKLFGSLVLFILFLLPNYIWAGIQCLTQKPRDIRGKVVLVRTFSLFRRSKNIELTNRYTKRNQFKSNKVNKNT